MFKKITLLSVLLLLSAKPYANGTVTLSFAGTGARAIGFLNKEGTAVTGMRYGILIDSGNDGFSPGSYASFSTAATGITPINVPLLAGGFSNDYFYMSTTSNTTAASISASAPDAGGAGAIGSVTAAPNQADLQALLPSVFTGSSSYKFGIIWFDVTTLGGPYYGFYTDSTNPVGPTNTFTLPPGSGSVPFNAPFAGTSGYGDGAKSASFSFSPVPEPSRLMFLGIGLIGLVARRRR